MSVAARVHVRWLFPLLLALASVTRPTLFGGLYLLVLLAWLPAPLPWQEARWTLWLSRVAVWVSAFACLGHVVFQIVLASGSPYATNISKKALFVLLQIGLTRLDVHWYHGVRWLLPDLVVLVAGAFALRACKHYRTKARELRTATPFQRLPTSLSPALAGPKASGASMSRSPPPRSPSPLAPQIAPVALSTMNGSFQRSATLQLPGVLPTSAPGESAVLPRQPSLAGGVSSPTQRARTPRPALAASKWQRALQAAVLLLVALAGISGPSMIGAVYVAFGTAVLFSMCSPSPRFTLLLESYSHLVPGQRFIFAIMVVHAIVLYLFQFSFACSAQTDDSNDAAVMFALFAYWDTCSAGAIYKAQVTSLAWSFWLLPLFLLASIAIMGYLFCSRRALMATSRNLRTPRPPSLLARSESSPQGAKSRWVSWILATLRLILNNRHVFFCVTSIGWALWYPSALTFVMFFAGLVLLQCPARVAAAFLDCALCYNVLIFWLYFIYCIPTDRTDPLDNVVFGEPSIATRAGFMFSQFCLTVLQLFIVGLSKAKFFLPDDIDLASGPAELQSRPASRASALAVRLVKTVIRHISFGTLVAVFVAAVVFVNLPSTIYLLFSMALFVSPDFRFRFWNVFVISITVVMLALFVCAILPHPLPPDVLELLGLQPDARKHLAFSFRVSGCDTCTFLSLEMCRC